VASCGVVSQITLLLEPFSDLWPFNLAHHNMCPSISSSSLVQQYADKTVVDGSLFGSLLASR
jgi:hypothetical protein